MKRRPGARYRAHLEALGEAVGLRFLWDRELTDAGCLYANGVAAAGYAPAEDLRDSALHELAHYLVAPPERRLLPNYGLGPALFYEEAKPPARVVGCPVTEEVVAVNLQLALSWHFYGPRELRRVAEVTGSDLPVCAPELEELRRRGFLGPRGMRLSVEWEGKLPRP